MTANEGRTIDLSVEVPGTPEEVWQAIATGPGISSWFVPAEVEEREGGAVRHDFGDMGATTGRVTAWDPPRRLVLEGHASNGGVLAYEWLVEAASGDTCVVRLVNSGFGHGEEWDGEFDGMSAGWRLFLENLRLHLTHFRSSPATAAVPLAMVAGDNERAWKELCAAFDVPPSLAEGDDVALAIDDGRTWSGHVERVTRSDAVRHCALVLDDVQATGCLAAEGNGDRVCISAYLYFHGVDAAANAERWRSAWSTRWSASP
jgi:uncharacterized protein YndB with AHSA1/START domain